MRRVSIVILATLVLAGCGPEVAKVADRLAEPAAARAATKEVRVAMRPALTRMAARSARQSGPADAVSVRSETEAAAALEDSPTLREVAQESDANIATIASVTTSDAGARARVMDCAREGALGGAQSYAESYLDYDSGTKVEHAVAKAVTSCLEKWFPSQATAVGYLGDAVTDSVLDSSSRAAEAQATAQRYVDWLVYTASLYSANGVAGTTGTAVTAP